jgi:hypothetical protein
LEPGQGLLAGKGGGDPVFGLQNVPHVVQDGMGVVHDENARRGTHVEISLSGSVSFRGGASRIGADCWIPYHNPLRQRFGGRDAADLIEKKLNF